MTLKQENGEELKFYPTDIADIEIGKGYVRIWENEGDMGMVKEYHLIKNNCHYTNWEHFLNQIYIFFDLGEENK